MIRVVLDTNVLASAALASMGPLARILTGALDAEFALIIAPVIMTELEHTLRKPYFVQHLGSERISQYIARLEAVAESVAITSVVAGVATHPEDDAILAVAVSGRADYLVTGDKKLQALGAYHGVAIASPAIFTATPIVKGDAPGKDGST